VSSSNNNPKNVRFVVTSCRAGDWCPISLAAVPCKQDFVQVACALLRLGHPCTQQLTP
jgi:hypothetical protein